MELDKKHWYIISICAFVLFILITLMAISFVNMAEELNKEPIRYVYLNTYITDSAKKEEPAPTVNEEYMLKEYGGRIGVYKDGSLVDVLDVYVRTLPESDRNILREGINLSSKKELNSLIEDYSN